MRAERTFRIAGNSQDGADASKTHLLAYVREIPQQSGKTARAGQPIELKAYEAHSWNQATQPDINLNQRGPADAATRPTSRTRTGLPDGGWRRSGSGKFVRPPFARQFVTLGVQDAGDPWPGSFAAKWGRRCSDPLQGHVGLLPSRRIKWRLAEELGTWPSSRVSAFCLRTPAPLGQPVAKPIGRGLQRTIYCQRCNTVLSCTYFVNSVNGFSLLEVLFACIHGVRPCPRLPGTQH